MAVYNLPTRIVYRKSHKNELIKSLKLGNLHSSAKSPNLYWFKKPQQQQQNKKMMFNKYRNTNEKGSVNAQWKKINSLDIHFA